MPVTAHILENVGQQISQYHIVTLVSFVVIRSAVWNNY